MMNMMRIMTHALLLAGMLSPCMTFGGDHGNKGSKIVPPVKNETYRKNCGSCHFAYQPGLLPARSWTKIVESTGAHPGGDLALDPKTKAEIKQYLDQNSAERSPAKRSKKILDSIGRDTPVRISETAYIKEKHRKIDQSVFMRKTISSRGNCPACHRNAESGIYEDNDAVIPD